MKQLNTTALISIAGGNSQDVCTALQNYANQYGENWTKEQWENWSDEFEALCLN